LRLQNGSIVIGNNQENASYPCGLCAERTALFAANSQYPSLRVEALAIAARNTDGFLKSPITPCGSCRQVMLEVEHRQKTPIKIYLYGEMGVYKIASSADLLPLQFTL
jgi:cytidine deaminase